MTADKLAGIIAKAIQKEAEAYIFYMDIYKHVDDSSVKNTLEWIAAEEKKHKAFLERYRDEGYESQALQISDVVYYQIAEYQEEPEINEKLKSEEVFLMAAHREKQSHAFYTELAQLHAEGEIHEILLKMANQELKHKEIMEYLYVNTAFPQTAGG